MATRKGSAKQDDEVVAMQQAYAAVKDLTSEEQARVLMWLGEKLKVSTTTRGNAEALKNLTGGGGLRGSIGLSATDGTMPKPKAFLAAKRPATGVERMACLAYYLTKVRGMETFKTKDLTDLNKEAAGPKISNAAYDARNATTVNQYLAMAGGGKKQITARGEAFVDALPDRDASTKALEDYPLSGRRRKSSGNKKKAKK